MNLEVKYPDVHVQLSGEDGNAFVIMGAVTRQLRRHLQGEGMSGVFVDQVIGDFRAEATSGDYDHLLQTCMRWVDVS